MTNHSRSLEERERAWRQSVILRSLAQASFEASYNAGWLDMQLAQTALIMVLYEISAHMDCTSHRMESAILMLDSVIRCLGLTSIDAMDPRAPTFTPNTVPALGRPLPNGTKDGSIRSVLTKASTNLTIFHSSRSSTPSALAKYHATPLTTPFGNWQPQVDQSRLNAGHGSVVSERCPCDALSLATSPEAARSTPTWTGMPRWAPDASWGEIKKEEARRLVWCSVIMLGCDAAVRQASGRPQLDLFVSKPENYALLYSGEDNYSSLPGVDMTYSGKE
ncbi:hypothetical protein FRB96_008330 [Tulasnella sp. 330]|nr:hypothetical protein FRB96_008330 [Tulasnella sp. 330]KAG8889889.1 hypothetical protein FRB98_002243 [Tulasnella sp. 332]